MNEPTPRFLLGAHQPGWLRTARVPLFVSDSRLRRYRTLPQAAASWALDSGGFTELQKNGRWTVTATEYAARVRRYRDEVGSLDWAAPQDWMCESIVISGGRIGRMHFVGTKLSVPIHQRHTVDNAVELSMIAPDLPWRRVLQGDTSDSYMRCADLYEQAGIDLTTEPLVGLGSVCRRQATGEIADIVRRLRERGITRLHGFGVKTLGLKRYGHLLTSADSLAWSEDARRIGHPVCGTTHPRAGKNCANCLPYALAWRERLRQGLRRPVQLDIWHGLDTAA